MIIANPIYDVVFKYLMEDTEIARELLSIILKVKVVSLTLKPQETTAHSDSGELRIFRLDFRAVIRLEDGSEKAVLIELQKAKRNYDILRFRKYLGKNYQKEEVKRDAEGKKVSYSLEIITVYFLGFELENVSIPVLKVDRKYTNAVTGEELKEVKEDFINQLTHTSFTIQVPRLQLHQQTELEQVLEVFSQEYVIDDWQQMDYKGPQKNPLVKKMVRRLVKAAANEKLRNQMDAEDEYDRILQREIGGYEVKIRKVEAEKEQLTVEKEQLRVEKEKLQAEKEKERLENLKLLNEIEDLKKQLKKGK